MEMFLNIVVFVVALAFWLFVGYWLIVKPIQYLMNIPIRLAKWCGATDSSSKESYKHSKSRKSRNYGTTYELVRYYGGNGPIVINTSGYPNYLISMGERCCQNSSSPKGTTYAVRDKDTGTTLWSNSVK